MPTFRVPLAIALGALAFALVLVTTEPPGPGLDPDAVSYVSAARSLVRDGTLRVPEDDWETPDSTSALAHFPPGFPAVLALPIALGMPALQGARLVVATSALATVALLVWLVSDVAGRLAGATTGVVLLVSPALASVHESALSEPLFLALLAVMLALMTRRRDRPWEAGLAAAAATLVRYAGVAAVGTVGLWWLLRPGVPWRRRVRDAAIAVLPAVVALGAWVVRTRTRGHGTIREFSVYGQLGPTVREGIATTGAWLAPLLDGIWERVAAVLALAALAAIGGSALRALAPSRAPAGSAATGAVPAPERRRAATLLAALVLLALVYIVLVVAARIVADPGIPLDQRLLSPFILLVETATVVALAVAWPRWRAPARGAAVAALAAWCAASASVTMDDATYALQTGNDYADIAWSGSRLVAWVREHARGRPLFTNFPATLYFHADRFARLLPQDPTPDEVRAFADTVAARHGLIVVFHRESDFTEPAGPLLARLPVAEVARTPDGAVYEVRPARGSGAP